MNFCVAKIIPSNYKEHIIKKTKGSLNLGKIRVNTLFLTLMWKGKNISTIAIAKQRVSLSGLSLVNYLRLFFRINSRNRQIFVKVMVDGDQGFLKMCMSVLPERILEENKENLEDIPPSQKSKMEVFAQRPN